MLEIELCRICLADGIRMHPIEQTRYHEIFEWYTEDTMDMNDELPYSVCYLCNAVLNRLYDFLKNMIDTEIHLKEILRNSAKLTYESVEKLKREMISKPYNLSKIWLQNSNFIALDTYRGQRPPRELQRYFDHPPFMITYHKPYEHMRLEYIPEEVNEEEHGETKEVESEKLKDAETDEINETESQKIKKPGSEKTNVADIETSKEAVIEQSNEGGTEEPKQSETDEINETASEKVKEPGSEKINEAESDEFKEAGIETLNEVGTEEPKQAETEEKMGVEIDQIKEAKSGEIKAKKSPQQKSKSSNRRQKESSEHSGEKSQENKDQPKPAQELKNLPEHNIDEVSETTADQEEFANGDDQIISIEEDMRLVWSPDSENEPSNMEIDNEIVIEYNNRSEQSKDKSEPNCSNEQTPNPIKSFITCAKKYRAPEERAKSSNKNVTKENHKPYHEFIQERIAIEKEPQDKKANTPEPVVFHNPYLQFIEERTATEEKQEKVVEIPKPMKYHNPYLQFIEESVATEEKQKKKRVETPEPVKYHDPYPQEQHILTREKPLKKRLKTSNQRIKTPDPEKYLNQNLQLIEHIPVKETEPEQTYKPMEIDENIHTNTHVQKKTTEITAIQLEERYLNLYLEPVKETPFKMSNEPIVIEKLTPVSRGPNKPVSKIIKSNEPATILVTSEPKKYIHSYVDFVKGIEYVERLDKESNRETVPIPPKYIRKRNRKKRPSPKIIPKSPVQENRSEKINIDGKNNGYCYFDHQKRYHRASILRKTHPNRNKRVIEELANKIKNRAAVLRKELHNFQKTDPNAKNVLEENAVTKPVPDDEIQPPGVSRLPEENSPKHLPSKSKNRLLTEKPLKLLQENKNIKVWHVQEDKNDRIWSVQEDNTMDSQDDHVLNVLDESLNDEDRELILQNEYNQEHDMPNDHTLTDKSDPPLQLKDDCIIIEDDLDDNNISKDQVDPCFVVQDVFTLKDKGLEEEHLIPKEQYDQIIMLANQDDQVIEDGNVAVKIESVDEDFQGSFEEKHEKENVLSDTETLNNEDIMDPTNDSDDMTQHGDIKMEIEQNMLIDDEVSEYEPYLQERVAVNQNTTQRDRDGPSNNENPDFESNYSDFQGLKEQEHYAIRNLSQISMTATVQLERLPIGLIKKTSTENTGTRDENDKYSCARCDFKTTVRLVMFRHQNIHDMNKRFVCNVCQHRFLSHYHLSRHQVVHDATKYHCAYCDFKTTVKLTLESHENAHKKFNRHPCKWCNKRFRSPSHRSRHSCKKKNILKCEVCYKEFRNEVNFLRHLDTHTGGAPISYKCSICYKNFYSKAKYINHYKQHRGYSPEEKKHTCKWCNKNFSHRSNCNKHMKLHEMYGEKTSSETVDKQEMKETDDEMELHEKESKKKDDKFACGLCPQLFDTETELGSHAVDHIL